MKAWYFSKEDKKLRFGDNRKIKLGITHEVEGEPRICHRGLHGSKSLLDALRYAPGPIVWRVELSGKMDKENGKIAATKRTYLKGGIDISETLRKFARMCALDVVHLWDAPQIVIDYLKTGDENLRREAYTTSTVVSAAYTTSAVYASSAVASAASSAYASSSSSYGQKELHQKQKKRLERMVRAEIRKQAKM